jgi:hypothetical protein
MCGYFTKHRRGQTIVAVSKDLLATRGVAFIDASDRFPEAGRFSDVLQPNDEGAKPFSRRLGAMCGNVNQLDAGGE